MVERLGIPPESVDELCGELYSKYGTTMAGLQAVGHHLDYDDWHDYVHGQHAAPHPYRQMICCLP